MSWLYSQALVEEYSAGNYSDGEQSAPLSGSLTQLAYCAPDKMTVFSRLSRYGMTYKPLTENLGQELLTLYLAGFHAKTSAQQEKAQESTESEAECGEKWHASFAKYDPDLSLWKTPQCSLLGDLDEFLETWPQWGLMRDGECWERTPLDLLITEPEFGWLPTPVVSDSSGAGRDGPRKGTHSISSWKDYLSKHYRMAYPPVNATEYMMGWPLGWTDLKPLEMDKFHCALQQRGESSQQQESNNGH
jgi:hypothetical protein